MNEQSLRRSGSLAFFELTNLFLVRKWPIRGLINNIQTDLINVCQLPYISPQISNSGLNRKCRIHPKRITEAPLLVNLSCQNLTVKTYLDLFVLSLWTFLIFLHAFESLPNASQGGYSNLSLLLFGCSVFTRQNMQCYILK